MQRLHTFSLILVCLASVVTTTFAQNKVTVVPLDDGLVVPVVVDSGPPEYLHEAIGKELVWTKGWDVRVPNMIKMDPTVNISFKRLEPVFGYPGIIFTGQEIRHWGEQTYFPSSKKIYAKAALMIDKGDTVQGGVFEWSLNNQGFISFHNIVRKDNQTGWIGAWTDPRPGDKVWFFIMADNESFASNPISFIWP